MKAESRGYDPYNSLEEQRCRYINEELLKTFATAEQYTDAKDWPIVRELADRIDADALETLEMLMKLSSAEVKRATRIEDVPLGVQSR